MGVNLKLVPIRKLMSHFNLTFFGCVFICLIVGNFYLLSTYLTEEIAEEFNRQISYPWKGDPECEDFSVQLADKNSLPKWPLTSFPGSGVTWVRQLIEGVTGIYTGSYYFMDPYPVILQGNESLNQPEAGTGKEPEAVQPQLERDNPLCGCTIIDKDHEATVIVNGTLADYFRLLYNEGHTTIVHAYYDNRGVLLLRNPLDVVFTYRNWQYGSKVGHAPPEAFKGPEWDHIVDFVAYVWADHAIRWIEQIKKGTVIFYEKLMGDRANIELERLLNAIDFHPVNRDRLRCTLAHRNRSDHRRIHSSRMILEPRHRVKLLKAAHRVQQSLQRRKWPNLPIHLYDLHIPDENM